MEKQRMNVFQILRATQRLNSPQLRGLQVVAWSCRIISGVFQGFGLLALIQLATALASGEPAGGLSVTGWLICLGVVGVAGAVVTFLRDRSGFLNAFGVMRRAHELVGNQLSRLPLGWFTESVTGRLSRLGAATVNELGNLSAHLVSEFTVALTTVLTLMTGLLWWYPQIGWIFAVGMVVYVILNWLSSFVDLAAHNYMAPAAEELAERVVEFASCQPMLRACTGGDSKYLHAAIAENRRRRARGLWAENFVNFVGGAASQVIGLLMLLAAAYAGIDGRLQPLEVVAVIGVSLQLVEYLTKVTDCRMGLLSMAPTIATIVAVLDAKPLPEVQTSAPMDAPGEVELCAVDFGYRVEVPVLRGVSCRVPARTMTAIVGPSGAGKTTIARLVCRFWDVDGGQIKVSGADVRQLQNADLMSQLSMVFQDVYLFNDTLEANIRVGRQDATDAEVRRAAELAGVTEIVARLPRGWDSPVGEGGTALSGGERQRVSIARAILKRAPVLLIDEATSALDAENEANLTRAFDRLRESSTVLVIAHKLETIRSADQILVLNNRGEVAQLGRHEELLEQGGIYRDFWRSRESAQGWQISR